MAETKKSLLIAEDTRATRLMLKRIFEGEQYKVDFAINGREAIEKFKEAEFDVVLTDLQMPVMDGLSLIRHIREMEEGRERNRTAVVAFTAAVTELDRDTCIAAGADAYITKPLEFGRLFALLEELTVSKNSNRQQSGRRREQSRFNKRLRNKERRSNSQSTQLHAPTSCANRSQVKTETFNRTDALERLQGDELLLSTLIKFFLEDHQPCFEEIKRGIANGETSVVRRETHALRGMASGIGGDALANSTCCLDTALKDGTADDVDRALRKLEQDIDELVAMLERSNS